MPDSFSKLKILAFDNLGKFDSEKYSCATISFEELCILPVSSYSVKSLEFTLKSNKSVVHR